MKRIMPLLFALMMCLIFTGCTADNAPGKEILQSKETTPLSEAVSKGTETQKSEEYFTLNETAVFDNLKITATELKESSGESFFVPDSGNVFVGIKFVIENISDKEQAVSSLLMFEGYVDDVKSSYSFNASCAFTDGTLDGSISPGKKLVGWYALEVPDNWSEIELQVKSDWISNSKAVFLFSK